jgi:hypothetical protein
VTTSHGRSSGLTWPAQGVDRQQDSEADAATLVTPAPRAYRRNP